MIIPHSITYGFSAAVIASLAVSLLSLVFMGILIDTYESGMSKTEKRVTITTTILMVVLSNIGIYYAWWWNLHGIYSLIYK